MILEDETLNTYGYYARDLKPQSGKPIIAVCNKCGKVRTTTKSAYRTLCISCGHSGKNNHNYNTHFNAEICAKMSIAMKGNSNALGYKHSDISKALMSKNHADFKGDKSGKWNGGRKVVVARRDAKRNRELGYTLLMPLVDGEVGHHVTDEYVIGISKDVHQKLGGGNSRKKHRTKVLQWLKANDKKKYKIVLCVLAKQ